MDRISTTIGQRIAHFLQKHTKGYRPLTVIPPAHLFAALIPGDVLLVEGDRRISGAIKYLTHSTWSHAAFYMGAGELIEADVEAGVRSIPLSHYNRHSPSGLPYDHKVA